MRKILLRALLLMIVTPAGTLAIEPIPQPLRQLYLESELIVVANVLSISRSFGPDSDIGLTKALLYTDTVLKGSLPSTVVEVVYDANSNCPTPPKYKVGKKVLAFLKRAENGPGYWTVGISWGAKQLSPTAMETYVTRIRELSAIESMEASVQEPQIVEWLVRCAEDPITRWEGASEFAPLPYGVYWEGHSSRNFAALLSDDQKGRLSAALFRSARINTGERALVSLLNLRKEPYLLFFIYTRLKAHKDDPFDNNILTLMQLAADVMGSQETVKVSQWFIDGMYMRDKNARREAMQHALSSFIYVIEQSGMIAKFSAPPYQPLPAPEALRDSSPGANTTNSFKEKNPAGKLPFGFSVALVGLGLAVASVSARLFLKK
jgi:hypothetical protein